ncbi:hypothetical protein AO398_10215 [Methylobacterium sp. GXS13]|jgi:hypothetical protein|uniref:hypothetical protein n=2 Tax=unclassified Methylobacterium TaxID=2615210 RepID=UPI00071B7351|nr:hypothetical protein [Methylobacterium sp. GXS13]KST56636.1 hypothetical protein AO398_10215 [Methylobacterium sp. GXS13]
MSGEPDDAHGVVVARLMLQLFGFAQGLGVDEATVQHIVERVIVEMPMCPDEERLVRARNWLLIAAA